MTFKFGEQKSVVICKTFTKFRNFGDEDWQFILFQILTLDVILAPLSQCNLWPSSGTSWEIFLPKVAICKESQTEHLIQSTEVDSSRSVSDVYLVLPILRIEPSIPKIQKTAI